MRWTARIAIAGGIGAIAGCGLPSFTCQDAEQCSLVPGGMCQADGHCSYPDSSCPSNQRYSQHAGTRAGQCVDDGGASSGGSDGEDVSSGEPPGTTGLPGDPCLDVDCGEHGQCEPNGDLPSCTCDRGWIESELQCVEDGCPGTRCLWVDAVDGDDQNPGTKDAPIRTLARVAVMAPGLEPGEAVVLRRGQTWNEPLLLSGLAGTERAPVIVTAFGDPAGALPTIGGGITVTASQGVTLTELRATNEAGTAVQIDNASYITVLSCEAFTAAMGCIIIGTDAEYTALVDNDAWECGTLYGIGLRTRGGPPGDHHWLLDNRIDGEGTISAVQVAAGGLDDIKVMRNYLRGSIDRGLHSRIGGHAWLVGNVIAQAGDFNDAALDHAGSGEVIAIGNIIIDAELPVQLGGRGEWAFNTIVHRAPDPAITIPGTSMGWSLHDNLISPDDALALQVDNSEDVTTMRNVYVRGPAGTCTIQADGGALDLPGWQALGQGRGSRCEAVPGLEVPAEIGSTRTWDEDGLIEAATPSARWTGCADAVGARDCDGQPLADRLPMFPGFGHGWLGPAAVQDRVELAR
ncbi:MAG: hypothetical protein K0V04_22490 [Deltaproteobacteria bacterium]|nr:hypothetical protein [Deltaproteobacteria bacterium]